MNICGKIHDGFNLVKFSLILTITNKYTQYAYKCDSNNLILMQNDCLKSVMRDSRPKLIMK
jgi:hypothetical protein